MTAIFTSASSHDSQTAILLMQKTEAVVGQIFDDLTDSAYNAPEIHAFSRSLGHVPVIDPNQRRGAATELDPAKKILFRVRTVVERTNSETKDNYGGRHIRVKGPAKVFCHLMFGLLAITVKQLFNIAFANKKSQKKFKEVEKP